MGSEMCIRDREYQDYVRQILSEEDMDMTENTYRKVSQDELEYERREARLKYQLQYNTEISVAREQGLAQGLKKGEAVGFKKGATQEKREIAKNLKALNLTKEQIAAKVKEIGAQITKDYEGKDVVLVGILKGAMPFLCDLMRSIDLPVTLDTMCVSSYGNSTVSSGHVKIKKDLDKDIRGKHVIVVEDIILSLIHI